MRPIPWVKSRSLRDEIKKDPLVLSGDRRSLPGKAALVFDRLYDDFICPEPGSGSDCLYDDFDFS